MDLAAAALLAAVRNRVTHDATNRAHVGTLAVIRKEWRLEGTECDHGTRKPVDAVAIAAIVGQGAREWETASKVYLLHFLVLTRKCRREISSEHCSGA